MIHSISLPLFRRRSAARGMTMIEVIIATAISGVITLAVLSAVLLVGREERSTASQMLLIRHANEVEEQLRERLFTMTTGFALLMPEPLFGVPFMQYQVGEGLPIQELRWESGQLRHYPNSAVRDTFTRLGENYEGQGSFLESVEFSLGRTLEGGLDSGIVHIDLILSDRGRGGHPAGDRQFFRSFWLNVRGG